MAWRDLESGGTKARYVALPAGPAVDSLPFSLKVLLENLLRQQTQGAEVAQDIADLLDRKVGSRLSFRPSRVFGQDILGKVMMVDLAALRDALAAAGRDPTVPEYVREAAIAHAVYQPEKRHPVEVGADQADHLVQWLSKRLGAQLYTPVLRDYGWKLVGGRLLPASDDPSVGGALARAQFMYENDAGERFTLYVSTGAASPDAPVAFRLTQRTEGGSTTRSLYWIDGKLAYALSGNFDERRLRVLADLVHARMGMIARAASSP